MSIFSGCFACCWPSKQAVIPITHSESTHSNSHTNSTEEITVALRSLELNNLPSKTPSTRLDRSQVSRDNSIYEQNNLVVRNSTQELPLPPYLQVRKRTEEFFSRYLINAWATFSVPE